MFQQACLHHHLITGDISFQSLWQSHPLGISQPVSACLWSPTVRSALGLSLQLSWAYADAWDSEQKTVSPPTCWYWSFLCPCLPLHPLLQHLEKVLCIPETRGFDERLSALICTHPRKWSAIQFNVKKDIHRYREDMRKPGTLQL